MADVSHKQVVGAITKCVPCKLSCANYQKAELSCSHPKSLGRGGFPTKKEYGNCSNPIVGYLRKEVWETIMGAPPKLGKEGLSPTWSCHVPEPTLGRKTTMEYRELSCSVLQREGWDFPRSNGNLERKDFPTW